MNPSLGVHQQEIAVALSLKLFVDSELSHKNYWDASFDCRAVTGYFLLFHVGHHEGVVSNDAGWGTVVDQNHRAA